jgi:hypothetical protein
MRTTLHAATHVVLVRTYSRSRDDNACLQRAASPLSARTSRCVTMPPSFLSLVPLAWPLVWRVWTLELIRNGTISCFYSARSAWSVPITRICAESCQHIRQLE